MASRQAVIDRSSELEQLLLQSLQNVIENPTENHFHQLRLTIKKIVAHLKLYAAIDPDHRQKILRKKIRRIFKRAGDIRDLQVRVQQLARAPTTSKLARLKKRETKTIDQRIKDFVDTIHATGFDWVRKSFEVMEEDLASLSINQVAGGVENYIRSMLDKILHLSQAGLQQEKHLHDYRIQLKQFYYNLLYLLQRGHLFRSFQQDLKLIDDLQEELGLWHDQYLLLKKMRSERVKRKHTVQLMDRKEQTRARISFKQRNVTIVFKNVSEYLPVLIQNLNKEQGSNAKLRVESAPS